MKPLVALTTLSLICSVPSWSTSFEDIAPQRTISDSQVNNAQKSSEGTYVSIRMPDEIYAYIFSYTNADQTVASLRLSSKKFLQIISFTYSAFRNPPLTYIEKNWVFDNHYPKIKTLDLKGNEDSYEVIVTCGIINLSNIVWQGIQKITKHNFIRSAHTLLPPEPGSLNPYWLEELSNSFKEELDNSFKAKIEELRHENINFESNLEFDTTPFLKKVNLASEEKSI